MKKESKVCILNAKINDVFSKFMNFKNFEGLVASNEEAAKSITITENGGIHIDGNSIVSKLGLTGSNFSWDGEVKAIISREDYKEIQYSLKGTGLNSGTIWLQMLPEGNDKTKIRVVLDININRFSTIGVFLSLAPDTQIQEAVDQIPEFISKWY